MAATIDQTKARSLDGLARATDEELVRRHRGGDREARRELIERLVPFVRYIARRYANRGEPLDDLVQAGCVGLVKAVDRFDPDRGVKLTSFAEPNISGEIKRYFRDRGWSVRVPRDLQELGAKVSKAADQMAADHGRAPTVTELAGALDLPEDRIVEAMLSTHGYTAGSLNERTEEGAERLELLGDSEAGYRRVETLSVLRSGLATLPSREREIVVLRYFKELTQREIAQRVGISQMHVSRLLRRSLDRLAAAVGDPTPTAPA
jgi:RNA polymerase sigma-B factor